MSLVETLQQTFAKSPEPNWASSSDLRKWRQDGFDSLTEKPWPTKRMEDWKYTDLSGLSKKNFSVSTPLTQISGLGDSEELPSGISVTSYYELESERQKYVARLLRKESPDGVGYFSQVNSSFTKDINVIWVEPGVQVQEPIYIEATNEASSSSLCCPRWVVVVGERAAVTFLQELRSTQDGFLVAQTDLHVSTGGQVNWYQNFTGPDGSYLIDTTNVFMAERSFLDFFNLSSGCDISRQDLNVVTEGPGADMRVNGLYSVEESQHIDNHTAIFHQYPEGISHQLYKGILNDHGRAVFNGKIYIAPQAQKVNSSQLNKNLLLSSSAEVDAKPELDIYADDVKATHGATVGQIDDEQLFYLQSRAIDKQTAYSMLAQGFVQDLIFRLNNDLIRTYYLQTLSSLVKRAETGGQ